jgi:hypothetical protein
MEIPQLPREFHLAVEREDWDVAALYALVNALTEQEQTMMPAAREIEGLDEEIAVLRVRLRTALQNHAEDFDLLQRGVAALARVVAIRYRLSPRAAKDLAERMSQMLQSVGDQILPPE